MSLFNSMIRVSFRNAPPSRIFLTNIHPKLQPPISLVCTTFLRETFRTGIPRLDYDKKFKAFKAKQAKMQCDDGYPVHLKGGILDKILYHVTVGLCVIGLAQCFWFFYSLSTR